MDNVTVVEPHLLFHSACPKLPSVHCDVLTDCSNHDFLIVKRDRLDDADSTAPALRGRT